MMIQKILIKFLVFSLFTVTTVFSEISVNDKDHDNNTAGQSISSVGLVGDIIKDNWGGVTLSVFSGKTEIKSTVDAGSGKEEVANGSDEYTGYAVSFENKQKKGFSWLIHPRFMNHRIQIADFREEVRYIDVPNTQNIDYIVTDFDTGDQIDPLDVNRYRIEMLSAGLVLKGQLQWDSEETFSSFKAFLSTHAGVGLVELFDTQIELGEDISKGEKWYFGGSLDAGLSCGILINAINTRVELKGGLAVYPGIDLPDKAEFKYKYEYNVEKNVYERKRLFIDEVELYMSTVCFSLTYYF